MQHIKEEHHEINIVTAKKMFEDLWEIENEQLNDPDFNTREYGGKYGETPHYKNAEKVIQKYEKNARTVATNDITSHKHADIANIPDATSAISLRTPRYPSIHWIINAHLLTATEDHILAEDSHKIDYAFEVSSQCSNLKQKKLKSNFKDPCSKHKYKNKHRGSLKPHNK